jgi:hypothetical protein
MSDTSRKIVDAIHNGELNDAKELVFHGMKEKAGQAVDMKRVEMQVDWMTETETTTDEE